MTRRFLMTALLLLIVTASSAVSSTAVAADARVFMGEMWNRAVETLSKKLPQTERLARFRELFEADFDGPGIARKVRGSRTDEGGVIVSSDVISPGGEAPIKIDWRLVTDNGAFKINDIIIEGISMTVTQRSEFASVIQRHGGQVSGLLELMREKTKTASAAQ